MTKAQKALLEIVLLTDGHLSAEEVFQLARRQFPTIALGTVYRNLNQFADAKRIRRVARAQGADYFERNTAPHDHAVCGNCGRLSDIRIPTLHQFLTEQTGCIILNFDLNICYVCPDCAQKEDFKS